MKGNPRWTRRQFLRLGLVIGAGMVAAACGVSGEERKAVMKRYRQRVGDRPAAAAEGRLGARPGQPKGEGPVGLQPLGLETQRDGLLYVPAGYQADRPAPLAVMLHGAGGNSDHGLSLLRRFADASGLILLAPASRGRTWDIIVDAYGPDIEFIDQALAQTFERYAVDPARLAVGGFSDGASYALSVGLMNGDLFKYIIAFSPGFMAPREEHGTPRIFISHGTQDEVLPIDRCSRRLVPALQQAGHDVQYHEFDGPHTIPADIAQAAMDWFIGTPG